MKLSCVLTLAGPYPVIAKTVAHLQTQTIATQLELVLVGTAEFRSSIPESELSSFAAWQFVAMPSLPYSAAAFAAGAIAARAPWVVLCEDHCFPAPGWAEALLQAAQETDAAVLAPSMENGNPATLISWANFLLCFPEWFRLEKHGALTHGPGHNSCYRKTVIERYSDDLERWFNPERVLHLELAARQAQILGCADAKVLHVNISRLGDYWRQSYLGGVVFGASRSLTWSPAKKLLYALASPLVPPLRWWRLYQLLGTGQRRRKARFWPATFHILLGLIGHASGEAMGYLFGEQGASHQYAQFELRRRDSVRPEERRLLEAS